MPLQSTPSSPTTTAHGAEKTNVPCLCEILGPGTTGHIYNRTRTCSNCEVSVYALSKPQWVASPIRSPSYSPPPSPLPSPPPNVHHHIRLTASAIGAIIPTLPKSKAFGGRVAKRKRSGPQAVNTKVANLVFDLYAELWEGREVQNKKVGGLLEDMKKMVGESDVKWPSALSGRMEPV